MENQNDFDFVGMLQGIQTGKTQAILDYVDRNNYPKSAAKLYLNRSAPVIDVVIGAGELAQGDFNAAAKHAFSAMGGVIGAGVGTYLGAYAGPFAPWVSPILAGGSSWGGSYLFGEAYDHVAPAMRWSEGVIRTGTTDYLGPYSKDATVWLSSSAIEPFMTGISHDLETTTRHVSGALEDATKASAPYLKAFAGGFADFVTPPLQAF